MQLYRCFNTILGTIAQINLHCTLLNISKELRKTPRTHAAMAVQPSTGQKWVGMGRGWGYLHPRHLFSVGGWCWTHPRPVLTAGMDRDETSPNPDGEQASVWDGSHPRQF
jgi:hypothetical protein